MRLNTRLNILKYLFLRNDVIWSLLDQEEKDTIIQNNSAHNSEREDYVNPYLYGVGRVKGGEIWDSSESRRSSPRGKFICKNIDFFDPKSVLEIGPGGGYYTRYLIESSSVKKYVGVEISNGFIAYLNEKLTSFKSQKPDFEYKFLRGLAPAVLPNEQFDLILMVSVVHHIPNRADLFLELSKRLNENGIIIVVDPSHYLPRILILLRKIFRGYYLNSFRERTKFSTHNFCTMGEFTSIIKSSSCLTIVDSFFKPHPRFTWLSRFLPRISSDEIGVVFKKNSAH